MDAKNPAHVFSETTINLVSGIIRVFQTELEIINSRNNIPEHLSMYLKLQGIIKKQITHRNIRSRQHT